MKNGLTGRDIINDIEFEIVQGSIAHNELGQSIQTVKKHHETIRYKLLKNQKIDERELASHQFQINEMLLKLLEEMDYTIRSLHWQLKQISPLNETKTQSHPTEIASSASLSSTYSSEWWPPLDIDKAMKTEALTIYSESRAIRIPIVGFFFKRLRDMIHDLILFYINRLAEKQTGINKIYGQWIVDFIQQQQQQQQRIAQLESQLANMQNKTGSVDISKF